MPKRLLVIITLFLLIIGALGGVFYLYIKSRTYTSTKPPENSGLWSEMRASPPKIFFTGKVTSFKADDKSVSVVSLDNTMVDVTIKCTPEVTILNEITLFPDSLTQKTFDNKFTRDLDLFSVIKEGDTLTYGCKEESCNVAFGVCTLTRKNNEKPE